MAISVAILFSDFRTLGKNLSVSHASLVELNVFIRGLIVLRKCITVFCGSNGIGDKVILWFDRFPVFAF